MVSLDKTPEPGGRQVPPEASFNTPVGNQHRSRIGELFNRARDWWDREDRPDIFELHYVYVPLAVGAIALGIGFADETLGTHIADNMAHVQVKPHSNAFYRTIEEAVHSIGVQAQKAEGH